MSLIRILVVEDYDPWRRFVSSMVASESQWQVVCEASDGLDAVRKAEELKPDLILLDINLRALNGIEAARRIRQSSPNSGILFLSACNSPDIVQEALSAGGQAFVYKANARTELLPAIKTVLRDSQPVGASSERAMKRINLDFNVSAGPTREVHASSLADRLYAEMQTARKDWLVATEELTQALALFRDLSGTPASPDGNLAIRSARLRDSLALKKYRAAFRAYVDAERVNRQNRPYIAGSSIGT